MQEIAELLALTIASYMSSPCLRHSSSTCHVNEASLVSGILCLLIAILSIKPTHILERECISIEF